MCGRYLPQNCVLVYGNGLEGVMEPLHPHCGRYLPQNCVLVCRNGLEGVIEPLHPHYTEDSQLHEDQ